MTNKEDRARGCLFGLAVGDALGTTLEFKERDTYDHITDMVGGGPFRLNPGEWTDDTSMALALAQAIIDTGKIDQIQILKNFRAWYERGEFSHNGRCFDIGTTVRNAITRFIMSQETQPICGDSYFLNSGNGGIMRMAPAIIVARSYDEAQLFNKLQSETTHNSHDCMTAADYFGGMIWDIIEHGDTDSTTSLYLDKPREEISSSGYVMHTMDAAIWSFVTTDTFEDCVLTAANLGDDADTVAAVAGQIAGAYYGYSSIPEKWLTILAWHDKIEDVFQKLWMMRNETD